MDTKAIRPIDVRHRGRERVICVWLVGDVLVDCGPSTRIETLLSELGDVVPRALALTHIHLDHAGAAGTLVERFPEMEVWVHERGAPHVVDPSRLLASATRLYGADMDRLWGEVRPVPAENVRALAGDERLGDLEVAYTPGHASHHVSYLHVPTRTALVGDVAGVRITPSSYILAPTPPPDIDIEVWQSSIDRVREWRPEQLALHPFRLLRRRGGAPRRHLTGARDRCGARPRRRRRGLHRRHHGRDGDRRRRRDGRLLQRRRSARPELRRARPLLVEAGGAPVTQTVERARVSGPGTGHDGRWNVIVRNDDHNTFDHVAATLARVIPGVTLERGYAFADRIHNSGLAIVWSGQREPAELYWEQAPRRHTSRWRRSA